MADTGIYDDGESFDATDNGRDVVPEGLEAALLVELLETLYAAGFREAVA